MTDAASTSSNPEAIRLAREACYQVDALVQMLQRESAVADDNLPYLVRSAMARVEQLNGAIMLVLFDTVGEGRKHIDEMQMDVFGRPAAV